METVHEGEAESEGEDGNENMYEDSDGGEERTEAVLSVECVGFANGEWKWVASGGMDKNLKVWDTMTGTVRCTCPHGGSVVALVWHSSLPIVCTAALDNVVRLWDARNGALLQELTGHNDLVINIDMVPITAENRIEGCGDATDMIVSVSDDKTARIFMINVNALVAA
jgi:WD40 repeat protein